MTNDHIENEVILEKKETKAAKPKLADRSFCATLYILGFALYMAAIVVMPEDGISWPEGDTDTKLTVMLSAILVISGIFFIVLGVIARILMRYLADIKAKLEKH